MLSIVLSIALCGQCPGGVCHAPVRAVVQKTRTVVVQREVQPVRTVVTKVRHRHVLRFRRG
jgi:hypothetical protein